MKAFKMANVLMKSFRSKAVTLMYPDASAKCFESTRGSVEIDLKKCTMCGACSDICPAAAVAVDKEAGQWSVQRMQCVLCGQCVEICPEGCLFMKNEYTGAETEKIMDVYDPSDLEAESEEVSADPEAESADTEADDASGEDNQEKQ